MIIIIEGIDRVGKTTLANKINKKYGIEIFKPDRLESIESKEEYYYVPKVDKDEMLNTGRAIGLVEFWNSGIFRDTIILDRFHMTEYVYTVLERDATVDKSTTYDRVENELIKNNQNYILILVQPTNLKMSSNEHGKDLSEYDKYFNELFYECKLNNKFLCDYKTLDSALDLVGMYLSNNLNVLDKKTDIALDMYKRRFVQQGELQ